MNRNSSIANTHWMNAFKKPGIYQDPWRTSEGFPLHRASLRALSFCPEDLSTPAWAYQSCSWSRRTPPDARDTACRVPLADHRALPGGRLNWNAGELDSRTKWQCQRRIFISVVLNTATQVCWKKSMFVFFNNKTVANTFSQPARLVY